MSRRVKTRCGSSRASTFLRTRASRSKYRWSSTKIQNAWSLSLIPMERSVYWLRISNIWKLKYRLRLHSTADGKFSEYKEWEPFWIIWENMGITVWRRSLLAMWTVWWSASLPIWNLTGSCRDLRRNVPRWACRRLPPMRTMTIFMRMNVTAGTIRRSLWGLWTAGASETCTSGIM